MYLQYHDLSKTQTLVEPQPKPSHFDTSMVGSNPGCGHQAFSNIWLKQIEVLQTPPVDANKKNQSNH